MRKILFCTSALAFIGAVRSLIISGVHNNNTAFLGGISVALFLYGFFYDRLIKIKWLTIAIVAVIFSVASFSAFLGIYGRRDTATFDEDVAIVLGAGILDGYVRDTLGRRLDAAVEYHRLNPNATIVVSGGLGHRETITEAEAMARYLIVRGVPAEQLLLEDVAYSTYSNMRFSRAVLNEHFDDVPRVVVITSDFHMYRSIRFAERAGIYNATAFPSGTSWRYKPFAYVREVAAVVKMWVVGR